MRNTNKNYVSLTNQRELKSVGNFLALNEGP